MTIRTLIGFYFNLTAIV